MKLFSAMLVMLSTLSLTGCGIRAIPQAKNQVDATLAEVTNQYKRRADLIPNLVNVVKGYAAHEQETLTAVVEARAKATATNINLENAEQIAEYQAAQGSLTQALSRLMVVVEKYPNLKADQRFQELQSQLEGTENRITVARNRHIEAIQQFNNLVTVPPESWTNKLFYKFEKMPQWSVDEAERSTIESAPEVSF
jgi:LemA protein